MKHYYYSIQRSKRQPSSSLLIMTLQLLTILFLELLSSNTIYGFTIPLPQSQYTSRYYLTTSRHIQHIVYSNNSNSESDSSTNNHHENNEEETSKKHKKETQNNSNNNNNNDKNNFEIQMSPTKLQHEIKKYKAQAEIDAILNDPDTAPFDLESELKKVIPGGISPPLPYNSIEKSIEDNLYILENEMYDSAYNTKDYNLAQKKKESIDQLHIDDCGFVLSMNAMFYKAFSNKDYEMMEDLWLHDACAVCIHPSQKPIFGANAVLKSWEKIFDAGSHGNGSGSGISNKDGSMAFQRNKIVPTNIRLCVKGTTATVTCDEEVYTRRFVRGRKRVSSSEGKSDGMELVNKLTATNIFRKVGGKWYIMQHHASWHHESDAAKKAMNSQMSVNDKVHSGKQDEGSSTVEGLLGIPGHEGLGGEKKKAAERKGPVRRVFTGSLSDLLGGGLNDILKGDMDDSDSEEIIGDDDEMDDEDDEEDDDDDEIIIANMMVGGGARAGGNKPNIITLNGQGSNNTGVGQPEKDAKKDKNESNKDGIRQSCIGLLRKLSAKGIISPKHKRMLLTDIITNSAKGEYSLVEVAYDLLCGEGDDQDAAEEDFAEQCQVFAATLPDIRI